MHKIWSNVKIRKRKKNSKTINKNKFISKYIPSIPHGQTAADTLIMNIHNFKKKTQPPPRCYLN